MFVEVRCDNEALVHRFLKRNRGFMEGIGMTMEEGWASDVNKEAREEFGEVYSDEVYLNWARKYFYNPGMVNIKNSKNLHVVGNDDIPNNQAVKELNKILGYEDTPIDKEAIAKVNTDRLKNLKMKEFSEDKAKEKENK